jgi:hypothetical protein
MTDEEAARHKPQSAAVQVDSVSMEEIWLRPSQLRHRFLLLAGML